MELRAASVNNKARAADVTDRPPRENMNGYRELLSARLRRRVSTNTETAASAAIVNR
jgi:hypothetical protein